MNKRDIILINKKYNLIFETFLDKIKKLNPDWNPTKAKLDFQNEYDETDPDDIEAHVDYEEQANEWLNMISNFEPSVNIGDWVNVYSKTYNKYGIGQITQENTMQGWDYGYMGYKGPSIIPSWDIRVYMPYSDNDIYNQQTYKLHNFKRRTSVPKDEGDYVFYNETWYVAFGTIFYAIYDEIQTNNPKQKFGTFVKENTFKRLPDQNLQVIRRDENGNVFPIKLVNRKMIPIHLNK